ncbi:hypothetical protein PHMEG_00031770 [Phytophthora megakarya]|uniref:Reverse transcriptase n=1 Tax=Phytophthora megakarya TaxID=4795 RepID=A0A225UXJ0_9STRA|nr:hypothetical protein PHMEG_00031770 [Phytophthora megakarya]
MEPAARSVDIALGASTPTPTECLDINRRCINSPTETHSGEKSPAVADLEHMFMSNYISLEDYAQELAFLPDLTESSVTELDYTAPNVKNLGFVGDQQRRLDEVLKKHETIMISSGNALSPRRMGWYVTSTSKSTHRLSNERGGFC